MRLKLKDFWGKMKLVFKNKYFLAVFLAVLLVGGFLIYRELTLPKDTPEVTVEKKPEVKDTKVYSRLLGKKVESKELDKKVLAVVVENHPDARPQSGLTKASVVYETLSEGGITRFLALFQENEVSEVGPVRSARSFFVDWVLEHQAYFAHVGGNIEAIDLIRPLKVEDINQFWFSSYFWRDYSRYAPHNVYTTSGKLRSAGVKKGYPKKSNFQGLDFKAEKPLEKRPKSANLSVSFSYAFNPTYKYVRKGNYWLRYENGVPFMDKKAKKQIAPKNIIVEFTSFSYGVTRAGEQATRVKTVGKGKALFFIDGLKTEGTWRKKSRKSKTEFLDKNGNKIKLNPGQTWIEVVPIGNSVSYSKT